MSKGNLFLGFGRGSVGDVTLYHQDGEQIARARNRSPRNPKTALQLLQRVVLKTSSMGYSLFQEICNHSFQGAAEGTESQARFNKANIAMMRTKLGDIINSGDAEEIFGSSDFNYSYNGASLVEFMPFIISEGSLSKIPVIWGKDLASPAFIINVDLGKANPSYVDVINALGVQGGDQLTFSACSIDDTEENGQFNGFEYGRVILAPAGGDGSIAFVSGGAINDPNEKNDGQFEFSVVQVSSAYYLTFRCTKFSNSAGVANAMAAGTVILSRQSGGVWQRSPQELVLRPFTVSVAGHLTNDHGVDYLGDAVLSFMQSESSTLYLNQAEHGGGGGGGTEVDDFTVYRVMIDSQERGRSGTYTTGERPTAVLSKTGGLAGHVYGARFHYGSQTAGTASFSGNTCTVQCTESSGTMNLEILKDGVVIDTWCTVNIGGD